jgi:hypothetical protein
VKGNRRRKRARGRKRGKGNQGEIIEKEGKSKEKGSSSKVVEIKTERSQFLCVLCLLPVIAITKEDRYLRASWKKDSMKIIELWFSTIEERGHTWASNNAAKSAGDSRKNC